MIMLRMRSLMWFAAGLVVALVSVSLAWQAYALPGASESTIVSVTPARVLDTRDPTNLGLAGPFVSAVSQKLQVTGSIATSTGAQVVVPAGATGVLLNVTVVGPSADGFLSIRPGDAVGAPSTSSLNVEAGAIIPNAVQVAVPTAGAGAGKIDITYDAYGTAGPHTEVLIDVVGYMTNVGLQDLLANVYTKAQVDAKFATTGKVTVGAASFGASGTSSATWQNGCARNITTPFDVRAGLQLPVGVTITKLTGWVVDSDVVLNSTVKLYRVAVFYEPLATANSSGSAGLQQVSATLATPELVSSGEYFSVEFTGGDGNATHQVCGVEIEYSIPTGQSVLSADANQNEGGGVPTGS